MSTAPRFSVSRSPDQSVSARVAPDLRRSTKSGVAMQGLPDQPPPG